MRRQCGSTSSVTFRKFTSIEGRVRRAACLQRAGERAIARFSGLVRNLHEGGHCSSTSQERPELMRLHTLLLATAFAAGSTPLIASKEADRIARAGVARPGPEDVIADFTHFAGSERNARQLVEALRFGAEGVLVDRDATVVRFEPPTDPLGYANVAAALSLAQTLLVTHGILQPHAADVAAALVGGEVPVDGEWVEIAGVLQMRSGGLSWAEIAESFGLSLADAISLAGSGDADVRAEIAARRTRRDVEIVDRSIVARPVTRIERPDRVERRGK
jgi:hypothetical protein